MREFHPDKGRLPATAVACVCELRSCTQMLSGGRRIGGAAAAEHFHEVRGLIAR